MTIATAAESQQQLDTTGVLVHPRGDYYAPGNTYSWLPEVPLFLDSNMDLSGPGGACFLNTTYCGTAAFVGVSRGLISDNHFQQGGGFRTRGDCHLWSNGDHCSMGPVSGGWPVVTTLVVRMSVIRHGPTWHVTGLCGMQSAGYPDFPEPWQVYAANNLLTLSLRTTDGTIRRFSTPLLDATTSADFAWSVNFPAGTVTCVLNGSTAAVTGTLPSGLRLRRNSIWGFAVGQITPTPAAEGYWTTEYSDLTILDLEVTTNGTQLVKVYCGYPRPATYSGGPSLPLLPASSPVGGRWLLVVKRGQGSLGIASRVRVHDIKFTGLVSTPIVQHGGVQGGLTFERVLFSGGSRQNNSLMLAVSYPIKFTKCDFEYPSDCFIFWWRTSQGSSITDCNFSYPQRCSLHLLGCNMSVRDCGEYPPGIEPEASVIQSGGQITVDNYLSNFEYTTTTYRMFQFEPRSWDSDVFPSSLTVKGCLFQATGTIGDTMGLVDVLPAFGTYVGATRVTIDGRVTYHANEPPPAGGGTTNVTNNITIGANALLTLSTARPPAKSHLSFGRGEQAVIPFTSSPPEDLSDSELVFYVSQKGAASPALTLTTGGGVGSLTADGAGVVTIAAAQLASLSGEYLFELWDAAPPRLLAWGWLDVAPTIHAAVEGGSP